MDYQSLGNIFKGLSASGSWGCFDEFNRLVPEVLSVCSVQFKAVCDGIRAQRHTVVIEGDEVHLDWAAGAFITMNPGYLGRSELPEGLKSLFRPITVMVPDLVLICENMLMAEGFVEAKVLASKFYSLYALLRELLSKQAHYGESQPHMRLQEDAAAAASTRTLRLSCSRRHHPTPFRTASRGSALACARSLPRCC